VFGIADLKYGEELCAWVILHDGQAMTDEDLRAFCRGQIAHHKIPRHVRFVGEFPMTVTGKCKKFEMRAAMEAELGVEKVATA
jgi:fatty-acyl-CoA synthase